MANANVPRDAPQRSEAKSLVYNKNNVDLIKSNKFIAFCPLSLIVLNQIETIIRCRVDPVTFLYKGR